MSALNDGRCEKCGKRYGWAGKMTDMPPCPRCGHVPDKADLEADQKHMDELEAIRLEKRKKREGAPE